MRTPNSTKSPKSKSLKVSKKLDIYPVINLFYYIISPLYIVISTIIMKKKKKRVVNAIVCIPCSMSPLWLKLRSSGSFHRAAQV